MRHICRAYACSNRYATDKNTININKLNKFFGRVAGFFSKYVNITDKHTGA
jgi:hypothetical protein